MRSLFKLVGLLIIMMGMAWGQGQAVPKGFVTPYSQAAVSPSGAFAYLNVDASGNLNTTGGSGVLLQIGGFVASYAPVAQDAAGNWHYLQVDGSGNLKVTGGGGGNVSGTGLTSGLPVLGNGTSNIAVGAINLAGGSSYVTGFLPVANLCAAGATNGTFLRGDCTWSNTITGSMNVTTGYQIGGTQITTAALSDSTNLGLLNASNVWTSANSLSSAGSFDASASTVANGLKVPSRAGLTSNGTSSIAYDTTAKNFHIPVNNADALAIGEASAIAANNVPKMGSSTIGLLATSLLTDTGSQLGYTGVTGISALQVNVTGANNANAWTTTGIGLVLAGSTYNDNSSSGTVAQTAVHAIAAPTLTATSATTYTASATLYIAGPPTASTNVTQTNAYAFQVNTGKVIFSGSLLTPIIEATAAGGSIQECGGLCTTATNNAAGSLWLQGSDASSGGSSTTAGYLILRGGFLTNATPNAAALEGPLQLGEGYLKGTAVTLWGVECATTTQYTVTDCSHTGPAVGIVGIATSIANPIGICAGPLCIVKFDGSVTLGDRACMGTTTDGLAHDNGSSAVCATAGTSLGIIVANSGTINVMTGATITGTAMSTTVALVQMQIGK